MFWRDSRLATGNSGLFMEFPRFRGTTAVTAVHSLHLVSTVSLAGQAIIYTFSLSPLLRCEYTRTSTSRDIQFERPTFKEQSETRSPRSDDIRVFILTDSQHIAIRAFL